MDDAGAALAGIAADMGAGEAQMFAQELDQQGAGFDITAHRLAIHCHGNCWHRFLLPCTSRNRIAPAFDRRTSFLWRGLLPQLTIVLRDFGKRVKRREPAGCESSCATGCKQE